MLLFHNISVINLLNREQCELDGDGTTPEIIFLMKDKKLFWSNSVCIGGCIQTSLKTLYDFRIYLFAFSKPFS